MKTNINIWIWNPETNNYDMYRFYTTEGSKLARHFLDCQLYQLTPILYHVHANVVDETTGITLGDFAMRTFDKTCGIDYKNEPTDINTFRK